MRKRTKAFASSVIACFKSLDKTKEETRILGRQMLRSGTSVAANYREASRSRSSQEFIAKIELCAQEADETQLWLELLAEDCGASPTTTQPIWNEAEELISIFTAMAVNTKRNRSQSS